MDLFRQLTQRSGEARSGSEGARREPPGERLAALAMVMLGLGAAAVLVTGHLSALVFNGGLPRYPADAIPGILFRVASAPLDPSAAWRPVNQGTAPAGPVGWWSTLLVLAGGAVAAPILLVRRADRPLARESDGRLAPATARDVHRAHLERRGPTQLVVGTAGREEVALQAGDSLLVIGPTGSGKTSAITIPAVLRWPGPVVATSTAGDFIDRTIGCRSRQGEVHVFDPAGITPYAPSGWSPLATSATWAGATRTAWDLVMAVKGHDGARSAGEPWRSSAARLLAPYLYAAARSSRTMADVARWIDTEELNDVLALVRTGEREATDMLVAKFRRDEATRDGLFYVMHHVVGAYLDPAIAASPERYDIHADELLDGDPHTLYIAAPHHDQIRLQPLFATLVRQVLWAVAERVELTGEALDPPLLLILDDAPNLAAVDDLPTLATTAAADGVQIVSVFRDLSQIDTRYDDAAPAVVSNHRAKLLLPGADELSTVVTGRVGTAGGGSAAGEGPPGSPRAIAPELARHVPADAAVLLHGDDARPLRLRLRPWYKDRELRRRAAVTQDALVPGAREASPDAATLFAPSPGATPGSTPSPDDTTQEASTDPVSGDPAKGAPDSASASSARDPTRQETAGPADAGRPETLPSNVSPISAARGRPRRRRRTPPLDHR